ncbi:MAG TPA: MarR family transcriptional regulator [Candidatus Acidoferrum sp.]|nr:MarR family transcriptional regulator [Candidatus Acidoferrum sp.]
MKRPPPTQKEKTLRAFRVYVELMETTAWLRTWMQGPFELFDLTPLSFRILVLLYEEGPTRMVEVARRMRFRRPNLDKALRRLEERGWVRRLMVTLPKAERPKKRSETRLLRSARRRWGVGVVTLTPEGEKFIASAFPQQAKVLKALMRALHGREQQLLVEICRKLRAGAILKFMSEISTVDEWERDAYGEIDAADEELEDARANLLRKGVEEALEAEDADEAEEARERNGNLATFPMESLSAKDRRQVEEIVAKMRKYDVLKAAKQVDWDQPPDEAREAGHALRMLMNLGNDREREVLERVRRGRGDLEVVEMLKEWSSGE